MTLAFALTLLLTSFVPAAPADRPAATILKEFDSVHYPSMSEGNDPEALAKFDRAIREAAERQQALASRSVW